MKNKPYIKKTNHLGNLLSPINGSYKSEHPNRSQRRQALKKQPFINFSKKGGTSLVVVSGMKFKKWVQVVRGKRIYYTTLIPFRMN